MVVISTDGIRVKRELQELMGLSTEDKPVDIADGSSFLELDTGNVFIILNGKWYSV